MVFERREDAQQALKRYNNLALDGRVMKIELIENTGAAPTGRMLSSGIRYCSQSKGVWSPTDVVLVMRLLFVGSRYPYQVGI